MAAPEAGVRRRQALGDPHHLCHRPGAVVKGKTALRDHVGPGTHGGMWRGVGWLPGAASWDRASAEGSTLALMGEWRWVSALDAGERS